MRIFTLIIAFLSALILCDIVCAQETSLQLPQEQKGPTILKVEKVEVLSEYIADSPDNIDTILPKAPKQKVKEEILKNYIAGGSGASKALFTIKNASIIRKEEKSDGWFDADKLKYTGNLVLEVKILDASGKVLGRSLSKSWGTRKLSGNSSIADREKSMEEMISKLIEGLMKELETEFSSGLAEFVTL